jgi:hypothetical protein
MTGRLIETRSRYFGSDLDLSALVEILFLYLGSQCSPLAKTPQIDYHSFWLNRMCRSLSYVQSSVRACSNLYPLLPIGRHARSDPPRCRYPTLNAHYSTSTTVSVAAMSPALAIPRPSASLVVVNARNEILFVHRNPLASAFGGVHVSSWSPI